MVVQDIWEEFRGELLGYIKARVNDAATAEDLLQDVFVKVHLKATSLNDGTKLTSWVYQITRNTIIDYYRKKKNVPLPENFEQSTPEEIDTPPRDFSCCLKSFIQQLPDKYRDALEKTSLGGQSQKDYAKELNLSYSAAKSRIQRARQKLKDLFVECCAVQTDKYGNILSADSCKC